MSTINRDRLPGHPRGPLGYEELHAVGDVLGFAEPARRYALHQLPLALLAVALPLPLGRGVGQDEPGSDAVHGDAERPELVRHLPGEPDLAGLRAGVGLDTGQADAAACSRGDVDDPAPVALLHRGDRGPGAQERAVQVGLHDRIPVLVGDLLDRLAYLAHDAPGGVDQDVDAADRVEERPDLAGFGEVGPVLVHPVHIRAIAAQRLGDRGADAVGRAGHHRGLAGQRPGGHRSHPVSSSSRTSATPASQTTCMSSPATLVHLKFSTQPPCIWSRSNWSAAAVVLGALYQLWNRTCTRSGRGWQIHSRMNPVTGALPPCPLTTAIRRKPCPARPSSRSLSTSM